MKAPTLVTQNRFDGLLVDMTEDYDSDTIVVPCNTKNGRGSQVTELGALEVCLVPGPKLKPITKESKEGVKDKIGFI